MSTSRNKQSVRGSYRSGSHEVRQTAVLYARSQTTRGATGPDCTASRKATAKSAPVHFAPTVISALAICSISKPWQLLAASTDFIDIDSQRGKTAYVGSSVGRVAQGMSGLCGSARCGLAPGLCSSFV